MKHCHEALPNMVSGSLLGLVVQHGTESILEITHSFPFPSDNGSKNTTKDNTTTDDDDNNAVVVTNAATSASSAAMAAAAATVATYDGHEYQLEMMRMLREVNVDNNCVGWYQSMYLGLFNTISILENQYNYQTELSPNSVVLLYDPIQTTASGGTTTASSSSSSLVLKCYRISDECIAQQTSNMNTYIDPKHIFEEIPITITNPGLTQAFLTDIADGLHSIATSTTTTSETMKQQRNNTNPNTTTSDNTLNNDIGQLSISSKLHLDTSIYDTLDLSMNPYLEKHLDFLSNAVDDLTSEQTKIQYFTKQLARTSNYNQKNSSNKNTNATKIPPIMDTTISEQWIHNTDAPKRIEHSLYSNQIYTYVNQMDLCTNDGLSKLFLLSGLQQQQAQGQSSTSSSSATTTNATTSVSS